MTEVEEALLLYESVGQGAQHSSLGPLIHTFQAPAEYMSITRTFEQRNLPSQILDFWSRAAGGRLYEDVTYGQWGLVLYPPEKTNAYSQAVYATRPEDYRASDLVIGEFLGDADVLLMIGDSDSSDFGSLYVASPLDVRPEWPKVGDDLADFLKLFAQANGEKYWE